MKRFALVCYSVVCLEMGISIAMAIMARRVPGFFLGVDDKWVFVAALLLFLSAVFTGVVPLWVNELRYADRYAYGKTAVDLLRHYRHDMMNHMQLIQGYVQMKRPERVPEYIREIADEAQRHTVLSNKTNDVIAFAVLKNVIFHPKLSVELEKSAVIDCDAFHVVRAAGFLDIALDVLGSTADAADAAMEVSLSISGGDGRVDIELHFSGEPVKSSEAAALEQACMARKLRYEWDKQETNHVFRVKVDGLMGRVAGAGE